MTPTNVETYLTINIDTTTNPIMRREHMFLENLLEHYVPTIFVGRVVPKNVEKQVFPLYLSAGVATKFVKMFQLYFRDQVLPLDVWK